jgi:hypothetical protein
MSKKSKVASKLKKAQAKRARKLSNRSHYQELARLGQNSKSKRALNMNAKNKKVNVFGHSLTNCGNIGCRKCNPNQVYPLYEVA